MSEARFTPGPWEACERGAYTDFDGNSRVILGGDRRIAVVQVSSRSREDNANAALIAAAPSMYAELERLCDILNGTGYATDAANSVLSRARGE